MADAALGLILGHGLVIRRFVRCRVKLRGGWLMGKHEFRIPPSPVRRKCESGDCVNVATVAGYGSPGAFAPKSKLLAARLEVPPNA